MRHYIQKLVKFVMAEDGPTSVEYAVTLALIIVVCIGAISTVGGGSSGTYTKVGNTIGGTGS